jgi:hypothetical protein
MRYHELRIAWSVGWAVAAVLSCVLWVQSYWWFNHAQYCLSNNRAVALITAQGVVSVFGGTIDRPIDTPIESSISSRKIWFETDYWQSDHWYFEFDEGFQVRVPLWFLVAMCGVISTLSWCSWCWGWWFGRRGNSFSATPHP